jgi:ribosome-associated protein
MNQTTDEYNDPPASKTQGKHEALDMQTLGESLLTLKPADRARLPLTDELQSALDEARHIKSPEARRRHAQFIGKLMRRAEHAIIENALMELRSPARQQRLEQWLTQIESSLADSQQQTTLMQQLLDWFPHTDRQHLRNLLRNLAHKQLTQDPPSPEQQQAWRNARHKLHDYLNELERQSPLTSAE